ncbi:MAG TPA: response regulator transcription factor [Acidimicrobiales bacterium]|nr:response regulator transcription factor [Acidimicrobiales bacterium]
MRVLVVEDDDAIGEPLVAGLGREGFEVTLVRTGAAALAAPPADLVLLDLGLPDARGFEVCRQLRARSSVPIIIVTARDDETDRVVGLELGADDYVVKPFGFRELVARIRAVSRRSTSPTPVPGPQLIGELEIDRRSHRVLLAGEEVLLTPKEFDLLALLALDPGAMVPRREILAVVWDPHWYGTSKTVDVHIASLRKKLGNPAWIETSRGVGFRLAVPQ